MSDDDLDFYGDVYHHARTHPARFGQPGQLYYHPDVFLDIRVEEAFINRNEVSRLSYLNELALRCPTFELFIQEALP